MNKLLAAALLAALAAPSSAQDLTLDAAKKVAARARKYAAAKGWKVSVAVANAEGNLVLFERGDGTYAGSVAASMDKARSASSFHRPTRAFVEAVKAGRTGVLAIRDVVPVEGGVLLIEGGRILGAVGVSGAAAPEDEEVALDAAKALAD